MVRLHVLWLVATCLFGLSACASIMLHDKIEPALSFQSPQPSKLIALGWRVDSIEPLIIKTQSLSCRLDIGFTKDRKRIDHMLTENLVPDAVKLYRLSAGACLAELYFPSAPGTSKTEEQNNTESSHLVLYGSPLAKPPEKLGKSLSISDTKNALIYLPTKSSHIKYRAIKGVALVAGAAIDVAIFTSSLSTGLAVLADMMVGYGIGCYGVSGNGFCE